MTLGAARRELIADTGYTCNKVKVVNWYHDLKVSIANIAQKMYPSLIQYERSLLKQGQ